MEKIKQNWKETLCYIVIAVLGVRVIIQVIQHPELFTF